MVEKKDLKWIVVGLMSLLVITVLTNVYFYYEAMRYQKLYAETIQELGNLTIQVNVLINYGNGTKEWFNNTRVPIGLSAFNITRYIAKVDYSIFEGLGLFITKINDVGGDKDKWWSFWYWRDTGWVLSDIGATQYIPKNGEVLAWSYVSEYPPPPPS